MRKLTVSALFIPDDDTVCSHTFSWYGFFFRVSLGGFLFGCFFLSKMKSHITEFWLFLFMLLQGRQPKAAVGSQQTNIS
jgi:hypothetical protein